MYNLNNAKILEKVRKKFFLEEDFIYRYHYFEFLKNKHNINFNINFFFKNLLLVLLSLLNLLIKKKLNKSYYFIFRNINEKVDPRCKVYFNEMTLNSSLNFIRCDNFKQCIKLYIKYPNLVFLQSFYYFFYLINYFFYLKKKDKFLIHKKSINFQSRYIKTFLKFYGVKYFTSIDDYRILGIFIKNCKDLDVATTGYMHARFSKNHISMADFAFNIFFVWSNFFKKKLINFYPIYKNSTINVKKFNQLQKKRLTNNDKKDFYNVLYLFEDNINFFKLKKYLFSLNKFKKINLFIKLRPDYILPDDLSKILLKIRCITIQPNVSFFNALKMNNIDAVVASDSTALLEASYFKIYPIMININQNYLEYFIKEKIVFYFSTPINFGNKVLNLLSNKSNINKILKIRNKVWIH